MALVIRVEESDIEIYKQLESQFATIIITDSEYSKYKKECLEENDIIIIED